MTAPVTAEALILQWCRNKNRVPHNQGAAVMREKHDGTCIVTDIARNGGLLYSGPTWEAVLEEMRSKGCDL